MRKNMLTMQDIVDKAKWNAEERNVTSDLKNEIDKLLLIIQNKDATLVDAGHTHVENVVTRLRNLVFGF
jgi:hypothetical protein